MTDDRIENIARFEELKQNFQQARIIQGVMPLFRPLLRRLGADVKKIEESLQQFLDLESDMQNLATLPDRFNDLFATRGWIIYERMKLDVARAVVEKAESGDIDGAEYDLVAYYSPDTVKMHLHMMVGVQAFRPRMRLAELAAVDYEEGRYHACVPVVLALLDGLVNQLYNENRGFFAQDVDLTAWDSIAAHNRGLNVLAEIFKKGRKTTRTEEISIPYRHGIMHGMDLGYDNQLVAAKAWAALFATRELALKIERGEREQPVPEKKPSIREVLQKHAETLKMQEQLNQWQPRTIEPDIDIPETGVPTDYVIGTPEHRLVEFLTCWKNTNYGYMAGFVSSLPGYDERALPGMMRDYYEERHLVVVTH